MLISLWPTLLSVLLTAAPVAAPSASAPGLTDVIIWGGGTTPAQAERWKAAFEQGMNRLNWRSRLPAGFPQIRDSASVAGLRPGFQVVVLGFCSPAQAHTELQRIKSVYAGAYVRRVQGEAPDRCPHFLEGLKMIRSTSVRSHGATLTASAVRSNSKDELGLWLIDDSGGLQAVERFTRPIGCLGRLQKRDAALAVTLCTQGCCEGTQGLRFGVATDATLLKDEDPVNTHVAPQTKISKKARAASQPPVQETDCNEETTTGHFDLSNPGEDSVVLQVCAVGEDTVADRSVPQKEARLILRRRDRPLDRVVLGAWEQGWEWGGGFTLLSSLPRGTHGRSAVVVKEESYQEGDWNQSAQIHLYEVDDGHLLEITLPSTLAANIVEATPRPDGLDVVLKWENEEQRVQLRWDENGNAVLVKAP